jgi:hypothetical protein
MAVVFAAVASAGVFSVVGLPVALAAAPVAAAAHGQRARHAQAFAKTSSPKKAATPQCQAAAMSASLVLTPVGGSSGTLAGAMLLRNVSRGACTLEGVPQVTVVAASGRTLAVYEHRSVPDKAGRTLLTAGTTAGSSITWSAWSCGTGSFSLAVEFHGWSSAVTVPYGSTAGYSGPSCTTTGKQTIYVGPVARVRS